MKNKLFVLFSGLIAFFFFGLCITFFVSKEYGGDHLLLAIPKHNAFFTNKENISYKKLKEINDTKFMITFKASSPHSLTALHSNYRFEMIATNYTYPFVTNANMVSGGFFNELSEEQQQNHGVLNTQAAFTIFGDTNIVGNEFVVNGKTYTVVGVINDKDTKNLNVYVPISDETNLSTTMMAKMDVAKGITKEYIQNELKNIGMVTDNYDFVDLNTLSHTTRQKTTVALTWLVLLLLCFVMNVCFRHWNAKRKELAQLCKHYYAIECLKNRPQLVLRVVCLAVFFLVCFGACIFLSVHMIDVLLQWNMLDKQPTINAYYDLPIIFNTVQKTKQYANILLVGLGLSSICLLRVY